MFSFSNIQAFDAPSMNHETRERELWGVSKKIPREICPWAPQEVRSLGPWFRKSVSINPRSTPDVHVDLPTPDKGKCGDS